MAAICWLAAMVAFLVIEASTVTMVSAWFAVGSLGAMIVALCAGPVWLQELVFLVVSVALLGMLRPLVRRYFTPKLTRTNVDSVIGSEGYVISPIDNLSAAGSVKLGAMEWTARSTDGTPIEAGTCVRVDRVEGVKVFVSAVEAKTGV